MSMPFIATVARLRGRRRHLIDLGSSRLPPHIKGVFPFTVLFLSLLVGCAGKTIASVENPPAAGDAGDAGADAGNPLPLDSGSRPPQDGSVTDAALDAGPTQPVDATTPDAGMPADASEDGELDASMADTGVDAGQTPISCVETTTCPFGTTLTSIISEDPGAPNAKVGAKGETSGWYFVKVVPNMGTPGGVVESMVGVQVVLFSSKSADFDLDVYLGSGATVNCTSVSGSSHNGRAQSDSVILQWPVNEVRLVGIHVIARPNSTCVSGDTWDLGVYGF